LIGLAGGLPAGELLPREALSRALFEVTASREEALQYGWPEGAAQLRAWIARRLGARGATVAPERVIVTAGAQQALAIAAGVLRGTIAVGDATYSGALDAFRRAGAQVVVADGAARYVIAGVSNPHGVERDDLGPDLGAPRALVVDEAYAELRFDGRLPRALIAAAPDRVWHVGTVSKTLAPGLRIGWLIPPAQHHEAALELKQAADLQTASLTQVALARFLANNDYDALVARARTHYAERAARLAEALRVHVGLPFVEPEGGFSIWIETDERAEPRSEQRCAELALLRAALAEGVMCDPGSAFRPIVSDRLALRVSYSNACSDRLAEGARRLAHALQRWRRGG
jgi:2-aminoadipate transaminase